MDTVGPRTGLQRKADAMEKLEALHADVWVATAAESGEAHLVPLSLAWDGERVILVTGPDSTTARNIMRSRTARLALGGTRDVVMIDARLDEAIPLQEASSDLARAYTQQADWDPWTSGEAFALLLLRPHRMQAWRQSDEIEGRTLMREGHWLV